MDVGGMESVLEERGEAAGEQSADAVRVGLVRKKRITVMRRNSVLLFVDKRSCVFENQNTVSIEAIMSGIVSIGDYELLEMQHEGYEQGSKQ